MRRWRHGLMLALSLLTAGCRHPAPPAAPHGDGSLAGARTFALQLGHLNPIALARSRFDVLMIDTDGGRHPFTPAQLKAVRTGPGGRKLVLAYLSLGLADDGRWYWQDQWDADGDSQPDPPAPKWLRRENPDYPGSYWVEYWQSAWRALVLRSLDKLIDLGVDGVVVDPSEAPDFFGPDGDSGLKRATADDDMVELIRAVARRARADRGQTNFVVLAQNSCGLADDPAFVETVDGMLSEDVWYENEKRKPAEDTEERLAALDKFQARGKRVFVVEYLTQRGSIDTFHHKAASKGYLAYATRELANVLTVNVGHEPG